MTFISFEFDVDNLEEYFESRLKRAAFINKHRFPNEIIYENKKVLEVGCGYGSHLVYAVQKGAKFVCGVEPNKKSIEIAQNIISKKYPEANRRIMFYNGFLSDLPNNYTDFDICTSFAVFEHVQNPTNLLIEISNRLKKGGKTYLGIAPLYYSFWGDHKRTLVPFGNIFPWAHLLFSEKYIIKHRNKLRPNEHISSIKDLELSCLRYKDYIKSFKASGLKINWMGINVSEKFFITKLLNALRKLPFCENFFTHNLYVILENEVRSSLEQRT